ncbi:SDR family NAD(P)-dependent oxidoreductase [Chitinophaga polysaccharea]|uniref:SDR family NAD(P)-dependent oxidoreductase n=1 Tax=Chitinophaga polysaccharea TaxID=1293035 RepID=UPI0014552C87|nr:SDR family NAD(P)-dependent oxidoreductase [Chitinophaga polysaccharea]NLR60629.1 SDR family NAD(P)-dependent oxidoreductase [Chitinophaga polysaccharea]
MTQQTKISILSCGWLGKPLALHLQAAGYSVKGARTSAAGVRELEALGLEAYEMVLSEEVLSGPDAFWDADILIVNIPPRKERGKEAHIAEIALLRSFVETTAIRKVLFVSSTSVYADINGLVTEDNEEMPDTPNGQALRAAETLLMESPVFETTVLRFGGLIGYDRIPDERRLLEGKRVNEQPMNAIHRDDCIGVIQMVIEKEAWGEIFNACATRHPLRCAYYKAAAQAIGLQLPRRTPAEEQPYKIVGSSKLRNKLGYTFTYDDPLLIFDQPPKQV